MDICPPGNGRDKHDYGFLGSVITSPTHFLFGTLGNGYIKVRRIPLEVGHHNLEMMVRNTIGPARAIVSLDVVGSKVIPVNVWFERGNSTGVYAESTLNWHVGDMREP
jgi:hypothetical protein